MRLVDIFENEPKPLRMVPDVGTIVEYTMPGETKPSRYRVDGWIKQGPPPLPKPELTLRKGKEKLMYDLTNHILDNAQRELGPDNKRLIWCKRQDAEYLSLVGVSGAIARVSEVKVVGRVRWSEKMIDDERAAAMRLVGIPLD